MTKMCDGEVVAEKMDGNTLLEKQINAYLAKRFIYSRDVPADECLNEAREVIKMVEDYYEVWSD